VEEVTPFATVAAKLPTRQSTKGLLVEMSKHLEAQAARLSSPGIVLAAFQDAEHFTTSTARRYQELASRCSLVAAIGVGLGSDPAPGVRGDHIGPDDLLVDE
jgi:DICT domain-containing protein